MNADGKFLLEKSTPYFRKSGVLRVPLKEKNIPFDFFLN